MTRLEKQTEILSRPGFLKFADSATIQDLVQQAIAQAQQEYYESRRMTLPHYSGEYSTGVAISGGVVWGPNGKLYEVAAGSADTGFTDVARIKKLWLFNTAAVTGSSSSADTDLVVGDGIPTTVASFTTSAVFHEFVGDYSATRKLLLYVGATALGTTPKIGYTYARTLTPLASDSDKIDVPDSALISTFDSLVNKWLIYYIGISA